MKLYMLTMILSQCTVKKSGGVAYYKPTYQDFSSPVGASFPSNLVVILFLLLCESPDLEFLPFSNIFPTHSLKVIMLSTKGLEDQSFKFYQIWIFYYRLDTDQLSLF